MWIKRKQRTRTRTKTKRKEKRKMKTKNQNQQKTKDKKKKTKSNQWIPQPPVESVDGNDTFWLRTYIHTYFIFPVNIYCHGTNPKPPNYTQTNAKMVGSVWDLRNCMVMNKNGFGREKQGLHKFPMISTLRFLVLLLRQWFIGSKGESSSKFERGQDLLYFSFYFSFIYSSFKRQRAGEWDFPLLLYICRRAQSPPEDSTKTTKASRIFYSKYTIEHSQ